MIIKKNLFFFFVALFFFCNAHFPIRSLDTKRKNSPSYGGRYAVSTTIIINVFFFVLFFPKFSFFLSLSFVSDCCACFSPIVRGSLLSFSISVCPCCLLWWCNSLSLCFFLFCFVFLLSLFFLCLLFFMYKCVYVCYLVSVFLC